jgi:hypothetical protein
MAKERKPAKAVRFRELEVARAIRAADRAGQEVSAIHIDRDGQVTLQVAQRETKEPEQQSTAT